MQNVDTFDKLLAIAGYMARRWGLLSHRYSGEGCVCVSKQGEEHLFVDKEIY